MTNEPNDVGPIVGGHLPATALDRARAQDILQRAEASGVIAREDYVRRLAVVSSADTLDDLIPLLRGLDVPAPARGLLQARPAANLPAVITAGANPAPELLVGILGGTSRTGDWRVRAKTRAICLLGGHGLDLRTATFDANEVVINVNACMGGVEIKVPAGVQVISEVACVLGGVEIKGVEAAPGGPIVRLTGFCFMGGVEVKGPGTEGWKNKVKSAIDGI